MPFELKVVDFLILSVLVLWLGNALTKRFQFLEANNIPIAVTGGLLFSVLFAVVEKFSGRDIVFDMRLRDVLLLIFFSTIGLTAKFNTLVKGGKGLIVLLIASAVFLVLQDATGIGLALLFGAHPGYGMFAGSVSLAGGHGTAIAWGAEAKDAGLVDADTIGIAFATFGLIAGGLLGGPIAGRLIARRNLRPQNEAGAEVAGNAASQGPVVLKDILGTILMLAICVSAGDAINRYLFGSGVLLPGFLTAMLVGIVITNLADLGTTRLSRRAISTTGDVSLHLFLSMSLMSLDLAVLGSAATPIVIVLLCQMLVITLFTVFVVFRLMGRDFDAAVICGGFVGLGLGATPVAIANMHAVTGKFGPSTKAFLLVPLVGAFFIDILNALVIKFFIALPMFGVPAG